MQLKYKNRIDISNDPLFFNDDIRIKLRRLKFSKKEFNKLSFDTDTRKHRQLESNILTPISSGKSYSENGRILDYIRLQNRELNQVRLQQKHFNKSRIMNSEIHIEKTSILPKVDDFLYRKTINNLIRKCKGQQMGIEKSVLNVKKFLIDASAQRVRDPKLKITIKEYRTLENRSQISCGQTINTTSRDRSRSIQQTIHDISENREQRKAKVKEIIVKTEETRERSMAAKISVYSEKPNSIKPTKQQLQQLRYKWVRRLKFNIELHNNQMNQFMEFLEHLRLSDIKINDQQTYFLNLFRQRLLNGDHLRNQDIQQMMIDPESKAIGLLLCGFITLEY